MSGSGSDYWYGESGVVCYSDHWGSEVASCDWYLDGVARCSFDDHYGITPEFLRTFGFRP